MPTRPQDAATVTPERDGGGLVLVVALQPARTPQSAMTDDAVPDGCRVVCP